MQTRQLRFPKYDDKAQPSFLNDQEKYFPKMINVKQKTMKNDLEKQEKMEEKVEDITRVDQLDKIDFDKVVDTIQSLIIKNKINSGNAFDIPFPDMQKLDGFQNNAEEDVAWKRFSMILESGAKIYGYRVDSIHNYTYQVLGDLNRSDNNQAQETIYLNNNEEDDNYNQMQHIKEMTVNQGNTSQRLRYSIKNTIEIGDSTLEKNLSNLNYSKLDQEFECDPLFTKTAQKFDQDGAKNLLLNNLTVFQSFVNQDLEIFFGLFQQIAPKQVKPYLQIKQGSSNILKNDLKRFTEDWDVQKLSLCPEIYDFKNTLRKFLYDCYQIDITSYIDRINQKQANLLKEETWIKCVVNNQNPDEKLLSSKSKKLLKKEEPVDQPPIGNNSSSTNPSQRHSRQRNQQQKDFNLTNEGAEEIEEEMQNTLKGKQTIQTKREEFAQPKQKRQQTNNTLTGFDLKNLKQTQNLIGIGKSSQQQVKQNKHPINRQQKPKDKTFIFDENFWSKMTPFLRNLTFDVEKENKLKLRQPPSSVASEAQNLSNQAGNQLDNEFHKDINLEQVFEENFQIEMQGVGKNVEGTYEAHEEEQGKDTDDFQVYLEERPDNIGYLPSLSTNPKDYYYAISHQIRPDNTEHFIQELFNFQIEPRTRYADMRQYQISMKELKFHLWEAISGKLQNNQNLRFSEIMKNIIPQIFEHDLVKKKISTQTCFITILHLANEYNLKIHVPNRFNPRDFIIVQEKKQSTETIIN